MLQIVVFLIRWSVFCIQVLIDVHYYLIVSDLFILRVDREYDPDLHCGVWIETTEKQCTRSFTCKV